MDTMNINTPTYVIPIDATSRAATLTPQDTNQTSLVIFNESTTSVFVTSGTGAAAPTAVFPSSSTVPLNGTVIGPGLTVEFTKNNSHQFVSAIQAVAGTGKLYIKSGYGK